MNSLWKKGLAVVSTAALQRPSWPVAAVAAPETLEMPRQARLLETAVPRKRVARLTSISTTIWRTWILQWRTTRVAWNSLSRCTTNC